MTIHEEATVLERLRGAILAGDWPPQQRLAPAALAARFETSTTVVREALTRLVGESLVEAMPNRGFFIPELDLREFSAITELRCVTETLALQLSLERGDLEWETRVLAAHHRLVKTPRRRPQSPTQINEDWVQAHRAFHHEILSACGSETILRVTHTLSLSVDLYRRWAAPTQQAAGRDVEGEHRELLDAALSRNATRASQVLREHYEKTAQVVSKAGLISPNLSGRRERPGPVRRKANLDRT